MYLQMIDSITSSAPPPIDISRKSRYIREISMSVYPIPPQYCKHASGISLDKRPAFNLSMDASLVTSLPFMYNPVE